MNFYLIVVLSFSTPLVTCQSDTEIPKPPAELKNIPPPPVNIKDNVVDTFIEERNINSTSSLDDVKCTC